VGWGKHYGGFDRVTWISRDNESHNNVSPIPPGNFFLHLLQPAVAECPRNPHNFLLAGISQPTHMRAILKHFNTLGDLIESS
jgi:hypothetical protein